MILRREALLTLACACASSPGADAFLPNTNTHIPNALGPRREERTRRAVAVTVRHGGTPVQKMSLKMVPAGDGDDEDDDDDDDEDDMPDVDSLGDWRQFRMNLAQTGLQTQDSSSAVDADTDDAKTPLQRPTSVSKQNEALLRAQNEDLYDEYRGGVWAHEAPNAEVGGVVCRLPLEAEIYRNSQYNTVGKKLQSLLDNDGGGDGDGDDSSASSGKALGSSPGVSFSPLAAKTVFWYRKAQRLIENEVAKVTASAVDGEIDASKLDRDALDMLTLYLDHQDTWQEVCLVLEKDERNGLATTLVLNRPMAFGLTEDLARLVLFGAYASENVANMELMVKFLIAFDKEIAIYVGGPDDLDKKATLIHGFKDLAGAEELAPGTGIYKGGLEAAVQGIMQGMYKPMDFRFFVGRHRYTDGKLDLNVLLGKYQPVACARSLVLKQCKALPKPLFHEFMELCGGELKEISSLELMKRDDIQIEKLDDS